MNDRALRAIAEAQLLREQSAKNRQSMFWIRARTARQVAMAHAAVQSATEAQHDWVRIENFEVD